MMYPSWTRYEMGAEDHRGLYPLGLEPYGASISRRLLPGITNVTIHIRYYSFLCWVFWTFQERYRSSGNKLTRNDQRAWRVRLENIHRAATLWRYPTLRGVVGVKEAVELKALKDRETLDATGNDAATPFQAPFYSASFQILRCGFESKGVVALTRLGRSLASAFDQTLRTSAKTEKARAEILRGDRRVSVRSVRALAASLALQPVPVDSPEHAGLVEMLFRLDARDPGDPNAISEDRRCRCLGLLLELVKQSGGRIRSAEDLYSVFASGCFMDGRRVNVPSAFLQEFAAWQRFQERQHEKLGIHGLWEGALALLRARAPGAGSGEAILAHVVESVRESDASEKWLGKAPLSQSVGEALSRVVSVRDQLRRKTLSPSQDLAAELLSSDRRAHVSGQALVLLLLTLAEWRELRGDPSTGQKHVHESASGRERLALGWLLDETESRLQLDLTAYLGWLVERCLLDQAYRVAVDKLVAGQFRFFILRDSDGYRLIRDQGAGAYLGYDSSRFPSAYRLLAGLNLVTLADTWKITKAGSDVLRRVLARASQQ